MERIRLQEIQEDVGYRQNWWTRSAILGNMNEWIVNSNGNVNNNNPNNSNRLLPDCNML